MAKASTFGHEFYPCVDKAQQFFGRAKRALPRRFSVLLPDGSFALERYLSLLIATTQFALTDAVVADAEVRRLTDNFCKALDSLMTSVTQARQIGTTKHGSFSRASSLTGKFRRLVNELELKGLQVDGGAAEPHRQQKKMVLDELLGKGHRRQSA